ncbi:MAG: multiheme c-type cytochrome [Planctomycetaceae bacterium]
MNDNAPGTGSASIIRSVLLALIPLAAAGAGLLWLQLRQPDQAPPGGQLERGGAAVSPRLEQVASDWKLRLPEPPEGEFVGSEACRACHAEIVEQYAKTGMGRSFALVSDVASLESQATPEFTAFGRRYRVASDGVKVAHVEEFVDEVGETICGQTVPIQYAMGSGLKGRSYVFEHGGALFMSPISWYAAGNRFDLSPGYRPDQGDRFERRITSRCLSCHVGQVNAIRGELDRFESPPFEELAIGCERCHGPGASHVRHHSGDGGASADMIVNPRRLPVEQREAVCNQCHLLGVEEILRAGRSDFDFRPGMRLSDVWTLFLGNGTTRDDGTPRAVSQVEQMRDSRCYRRSKGQLGCTSCHDPHSQPAPAEREEYYRGRCQVCHADQGCTAGPALRAEQRDSCINCHMPTLTDQDIPHVSQSDHSIPRVAKSSEAGGLVTTGLQGGTRRQPTLLYDGQALAEPELQRARGIVAAKRAAEAVDEQQLVAAIRMLERVAAANPEDIAPSAAIARCYEVLGKPADAAPLWREILLRDPANEEALLSMAQMHQRVGQFPEALPFIDLFLKKNDWLSHAHGLRAQVRERMGALPDALNSAQVALERDPTRVSAYRWLEEAYIRAGQPELAARYRSTRERLQQCLSREKPESATRSQSPGSSDETPEAGPSRQAP